MVWVMSLNINMIKKYKIGLVIGRFQPFHLGHQFLIEQALKHAEKIIIGVGSSNIKDENNPYNVRQREEFIKSFLKEEELLDRVLNIVYIPDVPNDSEWYKIAHKLTGPVDVVIGDNSWVNGIYAAEKIPIIEIGMHKRHLLEGKRIRHNMKHKLSWKKRVPKYLQKLIENSK